MHDIPAYLESIIERLRADGTAEMRVASTADQMVPVRRDDLATLERALTAARRNERAWLGFKMVTDAEQCLEGTEVEPLPEGSANADSFVFFANEDREIACSHAFSTRDRFQMLDVTRGPAMHHDQFDGLEWSALPLFASTRLLIFGAGEVSRFTAAYAADAGFLVEVADDDPSFLDTGRFPRATLTRVNFKNLDGIEIAADDFVCVLTRNHAHDPEALMRALQSPAAYVGLIGHVDKIAANLDVLEHAGVDPAQIERVHAPIGIECGAKTPAEIAISITAQLIQVRREQ